MPCRVRPVCFRPFQLHQICSTPCAYPELCYLNVASSVCCRFQRSRIVCCLSYRSKLTSENQALRQLVAVKDEMCQKLIEQHALTASELADFLQEVTSSLAQGILTAPDSHLAVKPRARASQHLLRNFSSPHDSGYVVTYAVCVFDAVSQIQEESKARAGATSFQQLHFDSQAESHTCWQQPQSCTFGG